MDTKNENLTVFTLFMKHSGNNSSCVEETYPGCHIIKGSFMEAVTSPATVRRSLAGGSASIQSEGARVGSALSNDELWSELNLNDLLDSVKQQSSAWPLGIARAGAPDVLGPGKRQKDSLFGRPKLAGNSTYNAIIGRYQANPRKPKTYHTSTISRLADPFVGRFSPSRHFEVKEETDNARAAGAQAVRAPRVHAEEGFFLTACDDGEGGANEQGDSSYLDSKRPKLRSSLYDSTSNLRQGIRGGKDRAGGGKKTVPSKSKSSAHPRTNRAAELKRSKGQINPRISSNTLDPKATGDIKSKFVNALISGKRRGGVRDRDPSLDRSVDSVLRRGRGQPAAPDDARRRRQRDNSRAEELNTRRGNPTLTRSRQNAIMKVVKKYNEHGRVTSVERVPIPEKKTNVLRESQSSVRKEWIDPMSSASGGAKQVESTAGRVQRRPARHESTMATCVEAGDTSDSIRTGVLVGSKSASSVRRLRESVQRERQEGQKAAATAADAPPSNPPRRSFSGQAALHPSKSSSSRSSAGNTSPTKEKTAVKTAAERKAILLKTEADKIHKAELNASTEMKIAKKESPKKTAGVDAVASIIRSSGPEEAPKRKSQGDPANTDADVMSALQRAENLAASISTADDSFAVKSRDKPRPAPSADAGAADADAQALAALLATHAKRISGSLASAQKYADEYKKLAGTFA